ncbi:MAG: Gfo/Idh/MocA family oxidoreductase [Verrucomicrobiaceae bacterium]|nr:Gfo/Idh/MocA family oxidoreductase [Verrucomicrobiaceae bacterium]
MNTRRSFLKKTTGAAAAFGFPSIIPSSVLGQNAPSNKITMAVFGWGMQGPGNTNAFMNEPDCHVLAACDLDQKHLDAAVKTINGKQGTNDCKPYHDYREVMARKDIDAVMIAIPDNWHALVSIEAAKNGKHIYGEKPLARTIAEQQAIVKAVQKAGVVWQTGSWQRSQSQYRMAAELVRNGLIGKLQNVVVGLPSGHNDFAGTKDKNQVTPPPAELDYEMWIGPATMEDYIEARVHKNWRWNYNIGGGQLLDWIGHHCDIAHWGMDCDSTGPVEMRPISSKFPPRTDMWNTATDYQAESTYANGVKMLISNAHDDIKMGAKWVGTDGWVWVDRSGFDCSNPEWKETFNKREKDGKVTQAGKPKKLGDDVIKTNLYDSPGHQRNFLDCIKSKMPTVTPVTTAHRSATPGHLALISLMTNTTIKWDPEKEVIVGNDEAAKLLSRDYRGPWKLEA